jgi:hypothetical protein
MKAWGGDFFEDEERAAVRGMDLKAYRNWRAQLRADYASIGPRTRRSRWRGTLRAWMAPGSDQATPVGEAA